MATRVLTRSIKQTLSRSYTSFSLSTTPSSSSSLSSLSFISQQRPLLALAASLGRTSSPTAAANLLLRQTTTTTTMTTTATKVCGGFVIRHPSSGGNDPDHWFVEMHYLNGNPKRKVFIDYYVKALAQVVGSEDEARRRIYWVSTRNYYAFGAFLSEELAIKTLNLPQVRGVCSDFYTDVKNEEYGGEPFINGRALPYHPKYHEWYWKEKAEVKNIRENLASDTGSDP